MTFGMTHWKRSLSVALLVISVLYFVFIWLGYDEVWITRNRSGQRYISGRPTPTATWDFFARPLTGQFRHRDPFTGSSELRPEGPAAQRCCAGNRNGSAPDNYTFPLPPSKLHLHPPFWQRFSHRCFFFAFYGLLSTTPLSRLRFWRSGFQAQVFCRSSSQTSMRQPKLSIVLLSLSLYLAARHQDIQAMKFWGLLWRFCMSFCGRNGTRRLCRTLLPFLPQFFARELVGKPRHYGIFRNFRHRN